MTPAGFGQAGVGCNKCGLGVVAVVVWYRVGAAVGVRPLMVPAGSEEGCRVVLLRSGWLWLCVRGKVVTGVSC